MQTTKEFSEELMNFPAAGFAVASFVNPDLPQPSSSTSPLFTPEPNAPTPSGIADQILNDNIFLPEPFITPSPTFYPENDFSEDNLLGLGTLEYNNIPEPLQTPPPMMGTLSTPPPMMETFLDLKKFKKGNECYKIMTFFLCVLLSSLLCYITVINKPDVPKQTSNFGSINDLISDIILND